jgi:hypothetical protein
MFCFPACDGGLGHFFSWNEYSGETHEGIIHWQGTYRWNELGASYTGTFQWGNFTGTGRIEWSDGSSDEGDVVNGVRDGHGIYRKSGRAGLSMRVIGAMDTSTNAVYVTLVSRAATITM